jgi:hypothetical protein
MFLADVAGWQFRRSIAAQPTLSAQVQRCARLAATHRAALWSCFDGVPQADPFFGYFSAIALERLSSVRVTRGGTAFGAGAAGTIELNSAGRRDPSRCILVELFYGSNNATELSAGLLLIQLAL